MAIHMNNIRRVAPFQLLLLGNIRRLGKHPWPAQYRWSPWQQVKIYSLFFYEYLYILMQYIFNQKQKVMFQSLELFPWKQSLKNQVFKKKLVFSTDIMTYNVNIK